ncbi:MAG: hypothetical protein PHV74_05725 [Dehalococcoidia bacterium]|nr:hypothetical protein [Dehalococcoidia bacterium]
MVEFREAMSVILMAQLCLDADKSAEVLGTSRCTVFLDFSATRHQSGIPKKLPGDRGRRFSFTLDDERKFLLAWETDGGLSVAPVHAALIEQLGHDTSITINHVQVSWLVMGGGKYSQISSIPKAIRLLKRS